MDLFRMLISDPTVLFSTVGLLILFGIGGFYVYYFITHIINDTNDHKTQ